MRRKVTKNTTLRLPESRRSRRRQEKVYLPDKKFPLRAFLFVGLCVLMTSWFRPGRLRVYKLQRGAVRFRQYQEAIHALYRVVVDSIITPLDDATILYKDSIATASATYLVSLDPTKTKQSSSFIGGIESIHLCSLTHISRKYSVLTVERFLSTTICR